MASLEKLSILGIRSFGPTNEQTLTFEKPLTLILGDNGCGKSTIIECLRYVTTQKEPSGKGTFIHDPNLTSNPTVKAYVKLALKDPRGRQIGLSKNSMSTRTRQGITSKSLDSVISYWSAKEKKAISTSNRCADFTPEIMRILGVSKAILENVIFCTQEDAHWPLDTDQKLKEKFDQIFDSDKYNKCLKKVQDQRKQLATEKKTRQVELKHLKDKKQHGERLKKDLKKKEAEVEELKTDLENLDGRLKPVKEKLVEIEEQERKMAKVHRERENKESEVNRVDKSVKELCEKIEKTASEFPGTDEELQQALVNCDVKCVDENDLKRELSQAKTKENYVSREMSRNLAVVGQKSKLIEINDKKIAEKEKILLEVGNNVTVEKLAEEIEERKKEMAREAKKLENEQEKIQGEINQARDQVLTLKSELRQKEINLGDVMKEKREITADLESFEVSAARRKKVSEELSKISEELLKFSSGFNADAVSVDLSVCEENLKKTEEELNSLENSLKDLRNFSELGSKLDLKGEELLKKTSDLRRLQNTHDKLFKNVLNKTIENNFARNVKNKSLNLSDDLRELRNRKTALEEEITTGRNRVVSVAEALKRKRADLQAFADKVNEITEGDELDQTVSTTENFLNTIQSEKGTLASSKAIYEKFIRDLETSPCCPLCKRDFDNNDESVLLIDELTHEIRNAPAKLEKLDGSVLESQKKLRVLLPLKCQQEAMDKLRDVEIPELVKEEANTKSATVVKRKELENVVGKIADVEKVVESLYAVSGDMALMDQLTADISRIEKEVKVMKSELPEDWSKDSLISAETEREKLLAVRKDLQNRREDCQKRLNDFNVALCQLQSRKNKLSEEELTLRGKGGEKAQQENRLTVLESLAEKLKKEINELEGKLPGLEKSHEDLLARLREKKIVDKKVLEEGQTSLNSKIETFQRIHRLDLEISEFERGDERKLLKDVETEIEEQETEIKKLKMTIENINSKLGDLSAIVVKRHELEDNLTLRKKIKEKSLLVDELKKIEKDLGDLNYRAIDREKRRLRGEEEEIANKKSHNFGKMGEIERQIKELERDLATRYKDVDEAFKKELIELKISEFLATDLLRYASAMDWAMNEYHKRQMEKVNEIVREYWRKIYRGNDVDYIEIQTGQGNNLETRRIYNYKLVQVKGDVRLDMRNRCSAGQKMLASLIIRMALAEVFSNNCGILTLDEPTTNLDRRNIRNLANTLNEIIAAKQNLANTNFQLIVITHDRDFIKELTSINAVEKFIEVSRDREGRSQLNVRTADRL